MGQRGPYHPQSSFRNYCSKENTSNVANIVNSSYNLPLLPHGGTKLAFEYNMETISPNVIKQTNQHISHPPLQFIRNGNEVHSNHQYEVPFSQYSSVNNLMTPQDHHLSQHTSFQPTSKTISAQKPAHKNYRDISTANLGDSLPSLLDSAGYINNNYNQNQSKRNCVQKLIKPDDRTQPQGSSSSNSITSSSEKTKGNHIHILNSSNYLGNI